MTSLYKNKVGEVIGPEEWAMLFNDKSYQVVRQHKFSTPDQNHTGLVSTIWTGIDLYGDLFETMIFVDQKGILPDLDGYKENSATQEEAILAHGKAMAAVAQALLTFNATQLKGMGFGGGG